MEFHGGPADGTVEEYPDLDIALPSLYWQAIGSPEITSIYHRSADAPDPGTGAWRYQVART